MSLIRETLQLIEDHTEAIAVLKLQLIQQHKQQTFQCKSCKTEVPFNQVILCQDHWYEAPYSCTAGDTWYAGEKGLFCPACGMRHRLLSEESKKQFLEFEGGVRPSDVYETGIRSYDTTFYKGLYSKGFHDKEEITEIKGIKLRARPFVNL